MYTVVSFEPTAKYCPSGEYFISCSTSENLFFSSCTTFISSSTQLSTISLPSVRPHASCLASLLNAQERMEAGRSLNLRSFFWCRSQMRTVLSSLAVATILVSIGEGDSAHSSPWPWPLQKHLMSISLSFSKSSSKISLDWVPIRSFFLYVKRLLITMSSYSS